LLDKGHHPRGERLDKEQPAGRKKKKNKPGAVVEKKKIVCGRETGGGRLWGKNQDGD